MNEGELEQRYNALGVKPGVTLEELERAYLKKNYALLQELGRIQRPVLLKRGLAATVTELLLAAEHILAHGNRDVILCERGIRTFETATRNTLDVAAVAVLKAETHLPVIVDPSHAGGRAELVAPSPPELIAKSYRLTPSELRVLLAVVEVGGVPEVALALGISETTVKTHLQRVFEKTASKRQVDLVKLVAGYMSPLT